MTEGQFDKAQTVAGFLAEGNEKEARNDLILLLDEMDRSGERPNALVNHLAREVGLYPHIDDSTASFSDLLAKDLFAVDVGGGRHAVLHRDQSILLKRLVEGRSLVVSAPTSFGKSFVIDALISISRPDNVMIVVPTIALADEARRRINGKFARDYSIITTADMPLGRKNIFVFPAERASGYFNKLESLDLLVVDEFYKASPMYEKARYAALMKLIVQLKRRSQQCYFLAPNMDEVRDNPFTFGMESLRFDLSTVVLRYHDEYKSIGTGCDKASRLMAILSGLKGRKTLVYVKSPAELSRVASLIADGREAVPENSRMLEFAQWFEDNYKVGSGISRSARHGILHHYGGLHRSIAQIVVKLFEDSSDADVLVATSSLIEGVNTSAENVILWNNKSGTLKFNSFTYRNIAGRAGRMFRHFVGNVYNLEQPPSICEQTYLDIRIPERDLPLFNDSESEPFLTEDQIKAIKTKENSIVEKYGGVFYRKVFVEYAPLYISSDKIDAAVFAVNHVRNMLSGLLQSDPRGWRLPLEIVLNRLYQASPECRKRMVSVIAPMSDSWNFSIRSMLESLERDFGIGVDEYFKLEKDLTYSVASLLQDCNAINMALHANAADLTPFINRLKVAFLPPRVYDLEEYGLPRMISRKIHSSGLLDLERDVSLAVMLDELRKLGRESVIHKVPGLSGFDEYIIDHFFDGIRK
ncbi:MAG: helicase [Kiritimatiellae bacterium]|nr:helicase [Kiritimatiellia bacterium]MBQ8126733.1 helicase [Kiritimatiellia bacterium]